MADADNLVYWGLKARSQLVNRFTKVNGRYMLGSLEAMVSDIVRLSFRMYCRNRH